MKKRKIETQSVAEIYKFKDLEFLVEDLIHKSSLVVIAGEPKIGKTALVHQLCKDLCGGLKFLNRYACRKSRVLFMDEDNSGQTLKKRLRGLGIDVSEKNLMFHCSKGFRIDEDDWLEGLKDYVSDNQIDVIVFDPFIRIHGREENNASEMRIVIQRLRALANIGATVIVVHHSGKASERGANLFRGSQEILAGVDAAFIMRKRNRQIYLESGIQRNLPGDISIALNMEAGGIIFEDAGVPTVQKKDEIKETILQVMRGHSDPMLMKDLLPLVRALVKAGDKSIREKVKVLKEEGKIISQSGAHNEEQFALAEAEIP